MPMAPRQDERHVTQAATGWRLAARVLSVFSGLIVVWSLAVAVVLGLVGFSAWKAVSFFFDNCVSPFCIT